MDERITVNRLRGVLLITMPANPDDPTVSVLQEQALKAMEASAARGVVLDISAVETLDSFFARTVVETAAMVKLMGGETVIVGMRPSVAITASQLGFTLGNVLTALDLDRALDLLTDPSHERRRR